VVDQIFRKRDKKHKCSFYSLKLKYKGSKRIMVDISGIKFSTHEWNESYLGSSDESEDNLENNNKGIRRILMKYQGQTIDQKLANKILNEIHILFELQDDYYHCYNCSTNLGNDCPDGYGCGDCCELGFYCDECAKIQNFVCFCGKKLE